MRTTARVVCRHTRASPVGPRAPGTQRHPEAPRTPSALRPRPARPYIPGGGVRPSSRKGGGGGFLARRVERRSGRSPRPAVHHRIRGFRPCRTPDFFAPSARRTPSCDGERVVLRRCGCSCLRLRQAIRLKPAQKQSGFQKLQALLIRLGVAHDSRAADATLCEGDDPLQAIRALRRGVLELGDSRYVRRCAPPKKREQTFVISIKSGNSHGTRTTSLSVDILEGDSLRWDQKTSST
ncbi:hypothetical protein AcV5_009536 [Taiwanofungus camphoratus]|nr:hypothetical protein AcV5_009536 [Antrodia cinnamomea]KAI0922608.1 hypothetical protein AcV5_009536 [Antrodia cinnamomea]